MFCKLSFTDRLRFCKIKLTGNLHGGVNHVNILQMVVTGSRCKVFQVDQFTVSQSCKWFLKILSIKCKWLQSCKLNLHEFFIFQWIM